MTKQSARMIVLSTVAAFAVALAPSAAYAQMGRHWKWPTTTTTAAPTAPAPTTPLTSTTAVPAPTPTSAAPTPTTATPAPMPTPTPTVPSMPTVNVSPGADVPATVAAAPAGTRFVLADGTYFVGGIAPKDGDVIQGTSRDGTILNGGNVRANAITGSAKNVTVANLTIENYVPARLFGAVDAVSSTGWMLSYLHVTHNNEEGISAGPGTLVDHVLADYNGNVGVGTGNVINPAGNLALPNLTWTVQNSELAFNGAQDPTDAAGAKVLWSTNSQFLNNYVHDNNGFGLWGDGWNVGMVFRGNTVTNNLYGGIFYEISSYGTMSGNTLSGNALANCASTTPLYYNGTGGVTISDSWYVEVSNNTLSSNCDEITAYDGHNMANGAAQSLHDITVHDNVLLNVSGTTGIQTYPQKANAYATSHWYNNTHQSGQQYWWTAGQIDQAGWQAAGQS